jgi:hypothetical protein
VAYVPGTAVLSPANLRSKAGQFAENMEFFAEKRALCNLFTRNLPFLLATAVGFP